MVNRVAVAQLRERTQQLDVILQTVEDGITVQDRDGRLVYANAAGARLIGYDSPEALLAAPVSEVMARFEVYAEDGRPIAPDAFPGRQVLLGKRPPEQVLGFRIRSTGEEYWSTVKAAPILDETGEVVLAVNVFADMTARKRAEEERERLLASERAARVHAQELQRFFSFLAEAGRVLASSLDYETTLSSVAHLAVPHIADWCAIHIVEEDGSVQQLAVAHVDPAKVRLARELEERYPFDPDAPSGAAHVLRTGLPEIVEEIPDEMLVEVIEDPELLEIIRDLGLTSTMVVPLIAREQTLGALTLVSAESGTRFTVSDLALAQELAARAALAVDNARLYRRSVRTAAEQSAILEHMADGVVMLNGSGTVVYMNRVGLEILGGSPVNDSLTSLIANQHMRMRSVDLPEQESALGRALHGEVVLNAERTLDRPDGREIVVRLSTSPIRGEDGTIMGAVGVFHDITAERMLEQEKEAFLAAAAHDLKTPLAAVKGLAQIMQRRLKRLDTPDATRLAHSMEQIDDAVTRMNRLVNDLLDASRLQMGRPLDLNLAPVDLVTLIHRIVREFRHGASHHTLLVDCSSPEVVGQWDADRLDRVFSNLISNAIKYSPDGGEIAISIETAREDDGPVAVVTVRDEGIGIPEADLERIFERFFRAGNVQSHIPGTGLGLASARYITEQHGGSIGVRSREGEGTTFEVRLPMA